VKNPPDYAGASGRVTLSAAAALPWQRFAVMEKKDGAYAQVDTDDEGRIVSVVSRTLRPFQRDDIAHLLGVATGLPRARLAAEAELHTEAGIAARTVRGYALLHLFDLLALDGRSLAALPYEQRYGALHRGQALAERGGRIGPPVDHCGDAHGPDGRYVVDLPRDTRLTPIVPLVRGRGAIVDCYERTVAAGGEGVVVVALDAPLGRRRSKVKLKPTQEIDAIVLAADRHAAIVSHRGRTFAVGTVRQPAVGAIVEVAHDGEYANGTPRFPRVVRVRTDLMPVGGGNAKAVAAWGARW
jgi:hypothetical protein